MTDMLADQAETRARRQITRDTSGQFIQPGKAIELKLAADRMRLRLEKDVDAMDRARGVTWEHGHYRSRPNTDRLSVEHTAEVLPLFEQRVAA